MSQSAATLKNRKGAAAQPPVAAVATDYVPMEAQSTAELYGSHGARVRDVEKTTAYSMFSIVGKHANPAPHAYVYNYLMEVVMTFVLGLVVTLGWFVAGPTTSIVNGVALAAAIAGTYLVTSRVYSDYALRRHLNPGITVLRFGRRDIGVPGLFYYWSAQLIGAIFCGLVVGAILGQQNGGCATAPGCVVQRATVPLPVTTNGAYGFGVSLTTVICLEIFVPMIIFLVLDLAENLNTQTHYTRKKGQHVSPHKLEKHYHHAIKCAALATFVFIAAGYPFQVGSYNGATYLAGVFSGLLTSDYARQHGTLATLSGTDFLANSVFGTTGAAAWALYFFGSIAGAVATVIVGYAIMALGFNKNNQYDARYQRMRRGYETLGMDAPMTPEAMETPLLVAAAQTTHTSVSDLVNPYSVASSVLLK